MSFNQTKKSSLAQPLLYEKQASNEDMCSLWANHELVQDKEGGVDDVDKEEAKAAADDD